MRYFTLLSHMSSKSGVCFVQTAHPDSDEARGAAATRSADLLFSGPVSGLLISRRSQDPSVCVIGTLAAWQAIFQSSPHLKNDLRCISRRPQE